MEIQTINSRELSELDAASTARTLNVLLVVPHYLATGGFGYLMWDRDRRVRGLVAQPHAAAHDAIFVRGVEPGPENPGGRNAC